MHLRRIFLRVHSRLFSKFVFKIISKWPSDIKEKFSNCIQGWLSKCSDNTLQRIFSFKVASKNSYKKDPCRGCLSKGNFRIKDVYHIVLFEFSNKMQIKKDLLCVLIEPKIAN